MSVILSWTLFLLSFLIYPICLKVTSELYYIWGPIEWDIFVWCRVLLISVVGITSLVLIKKRDWPLICYLILLIVSTAGSRFTETAIFGFPNFHEGLLALVGYVGIYLLARECKDKRLIDLSLSSAIFVITVIGIIQLLYGNFLDFPLFKWVFPPLKFTAMPWPVYSTLGSPNHLGLFCATLLPWAICKNKLKECFCLVFLLIGCQTRFAWASVAIITLLISRRNAIYLFFACTLLAIPFHKEVNQRITRTMNEIHWPLRDSDLSGRVFMWSKTVPMLKGTILIGDGPATYPHYFAQHTERAKKMGYDGLVVDRPHNMYLNIWQNSGLVSLIFLISAILVRIKNARDKAYKFAAIGFLIAGLFTDSVPSVTPYFAAFLGLMGEE